MRVLIAGAGRAGLAVAVHLRDAGHHVTVVDRDAAITKRAFESYGLVSFVGDATDASLLRSAELHRFDVVVAMLRRDAENLAVALLARAAGVKRVMVRMRDADYAAVYETAGITGILSEIDVFVGALATAVEHEAVRHAMVLAKGTTVAFELIVPAHSPAVGKTVSEIATSPRFPGSCVFAGLIDATSDFQAPRGASVVNAGMTVLLVARRAELAAVVDFFMAADPRSPPASPPLARPHGAS